MPLTDARGQNIPYSVLSDRPNAQTLGEGIVNGLVDRSVMRFPSAVVRGATIPVPSAGMVTWLNDVKRLEYYTGSSWQRVSPQDQSNSVNVSFTNKDNHFQTITFASPFDTTPRVSTNIATGSGVAARWGSRAYDVTTTNFKLFVFAPVAGNDATWVNVPVQWQATAR